MNPVSYAIGLIKARIPVQVLQIAFLKGQQSFASIPMNIDTIIQDKVINNRVRQDTNVISGTRTTIRVDDLDFEIKPNEGYVIQVPMSRTNNRAISGVYGLQPGTRVVGGINQMYANNAFGTGTGELGLATMGMANNMKAIDTSINGRLSLIAPNTILVTGAIPYGSILYLDCEVDGGEGFSHLSQRSFLAFADLCLLACKAYIYNELIVRIDVGEVEGGAVIGQIKNIVDDYASSAEEYHEMLRTNWSVTATLNDPITASMLVRMSTGNGF